MTVQGGQGKFTHSSRGANVLGEKDPLSLNHKEVDELVHISYHGIERVAGNDKVLLGTQLGGDALTENDLSGDFSGHGRAKGEPCELEEVSDNIKIPRGEDERNQADVDDAGSAYG